MQRHLRNSVVERMSGITGISKNKFYIKNSEARMVDLKYIVEYNYEFLYNNHISFIKKYGDANKLKRHRQTEYYHYLCDVRSRNEQNCFTLRGKIRRFILLYKKIKENGYDNTIKPYIILYDLSEFAKLINLDVVGEQWRNAYECIKNGSRRYYRDGGDHRAAILYVLEIKSAMTRIITIGVKE